MMSAAVREESRYAPRVCRTALARLLLHVDGKARTEHSSLWLACRTVLQEQEEWEELCDMACEDAEECCCQARVGLKSWLWFHRTACGRAGLVSSHTRRVGDATATPPWSAARIHKVLVALRRSAKNSCDGTIGAAARVSIAQRLTAVCSRSAGDQEEWEAGASGDVGRTKYSPFSRPWQGEWGAGAGVAIKGARFTAHADEERYDVWEEMEGLHTRDWVLRSELQLPWLVELFKQVGGRVFISLQWLRQAVEQDRRQAIRTMLRRDRVATLIASSGQQMALMQLGRRDGRQTSLTPWADPESDAIWAGRLSGLQIAVLMGFLPLGHPYRISLAMTDVQMAQLYGQGCLAPASDCVVRWCIKRGGLEGVIRTADVGSGAGTFMSAARLTIGKLMEYVFHVEPLELCRRAHRAAWRQEGGTSFLWADDPDTLVATVAMGRIDLWQYSFRCRPFSHANRQAWLSVERQDSARRAIQELIDVMAYVRQARPRFAIIENVAAIKYLTGGAVWRTILHVLTLAGDYVWFEQSFGAEELPSALSDRERMWMVGVAV